MADETLKSALDFGLSQLQAISQELERTNISQAKRIKQFQEEINRLRKIANDALLGQSVAVDQSAADLRMPATEGENALSATAFESQKEEFDVTDRIRQHEDELTSAVKRSSSFQRKHLEEQDARKRAVAYELSSDLLDKQTEVLRKRYGGGENCERAARVIQEAYRRYRMRINFSKIRRSKTRRLTLDNKFHVGGDNKQQTSEVSDDTECKVEVVELVLDQSSASNDECKKDSLSANSSPAEDDNQHHAPAEEEEEEEFSHLYDNQKDNTEKLEKSEIMNSVDSTCTSKEREVARILSEISIPGILTDNESVKRRKRKNRHGYETVELPKNNENNLSATVVSKADATKAEENVTPSLRRSLVMSSVRSHHSANDTPPPLPHAWQRVGSDLSLTPSLPQVWQRVGSDLSLTSYDNEGDEESLRSSDTASIASGQSEFSISNNMGSESYQRKSTLSTRGSWHIDSNNDAMRKRLYRIGLNFFNRKPEKGIEFLVEHNFISRTAPAVATFLLNRKGLSRQMVGEYLGNTQKRFNQDVLDAVCELMDFSDLDLDEALRNFQCQIKVQGEAQKVDRLVEAFSQRYCTCNPKLAESLKNPDAIFILAFAIIMLNTDLHSPNMKREKRMSEDAFVRNLRGVDGGDDLNDEMLRNIYNRIRDGELKTDDDHVTQVLHVEKKIIGKKPVLAVPHRRLVCYCRLYQVTDPAKPQKIGLHHRAVFLFNDLLLITKLIQRKKNSTTYGYKLSLPLQGMNVLLFETTYYLYGIRLINTMDNKVLVTFNAPNEHDRNKFVTDLRESINEIQQMETYRIGAELERAQLSSDTRNTLSRDTKLLSASMHNLNEAMGSHANISHFIPERPASLYTVQQETNQSNNNSKNSQKPEMSFLDSLYKVGKKDIVSARSPIMTSRECEKNNPCITITLSEV